MKKIIKSTLLLVTCYCITVKVFAQGDVDAIRYSETNIAATARSLSMAGAFGALGADFSALSTNPAGIAIYKRSEFTITPGLINRITSTDYLGNNSVDNKYNFNLGNLGLVWAYPRENKSSVWKGFAFGVGYNRLNSFHSRSVYEGINHDNSLLDSYLDEANGTDYNSLPDRFPFSSYLAYYPFLIDTLPGSTDQYFSAIPHGGELQRRTRETTGSIGEVALSFGANYNDKIYFGLSLGFPYLKYNENVIYEETDPDDNITQTTAGLDTTPYGQYYNFKSFTMTQNVNTTANGFNVKAGIIVRANDWLRFGAAIHSPTFYNMHDDYSNSIAANFEGGMPEPAADPIGAYDYDLTTPLKFIGSAAFIYKQSGIFSLDYEYEDYTTAKLDANDYAFTEENNTIRTLYTQQHNIRAGVEWKYNIFAFRGGAGYSTEVLNKNIIGSNGDQHKIIYTGGIGIREESYFVDLGYAYSQKNEAFYPYTLDNGNAPVAFSKIKDHKILLTLGFRF
jgi:long-subunit fatty acid transport protein